MIGFFKSQFISKEFTLLGQKVSRWDTTHTPNIGKLVLMVEPESKKDL